VSSLGTISSQVLFNAIQAIILLSNLEVDKVAFCAATVPLSLFLTASTTFHPSYRSLCCHPCRYDTDRAGIIASVDKVTFWNR